jgi:hypothetical protein
MSFRTFGWFGPYCATTPAQEPLNLIVHDYESPAAAPQSGGRVNFPLDVAMKVFWEAATFQITSTVSATIGATSRTDTVNVAVNWGQIEDSQEVFTPRQGLNLAKEMLCAINPAIVGGYHTLYRESSPGGRSFQFGLAPQPNVRNGLLALNLFCVHEIGALFPASEVFQRIKLFSEQPQYGETTWQLVTPWGSYTLPLTISRPSQMNNNSLTITVTAADPAARHA